MTPHKLSRLAFGPESLVCVMNLLFRNEIAVDLFLSQHISTFRHNSHRIGAARRTFKELI